MIKKYVSRYRPAIINWLGELALMMSTKPAERKLGKQRNLGILIDVTIQQHAVTHETAWISAELDDIGPYNGPGYSARVPVHDPQSQSEEYRNVRYLAGIARLAKIGYLKLYTSGELDDETFRQPAGRFRGYGYSDLNVLSDVEIESIDGYRFPQMGPHWMGLPTPKEQQRRRLESSDDPLYLALVDRLGPKNSQDAWHIRTAEVHDLFCYLTMDFRLVRNVRSQVGGEPLKSLRTLVLTPEEFALRFGLLPVPPHLLSYRDADTFVRADLHMPGSRRRPLKRYRH